VACPLPLHSSNLGIHMEEGKLQEVPAARVQLVWPARFSFSKANAKATVASLMTLVLAAAYTPTAAPAALAHAAVASAAAAAGNQQMPSFSLNPQAQEEPEASQLDCPAFRAMNWCLSQRSAGGETEWFAPSFRQGLSKHPHGERLARGTAEGAHAAMLRLTFAVQGILQPFL